MPGLVPGIHVFTLRMKEESRGWPGAQTSLRSLRKQTTMPGHDVLAGVEIFEFPGHNESNPARHGAGGP
jgi:hypothetical protein